MSGSLYDLLVENFPADRGRIALEEPGGRLICYKVWPQMAIHETELICQF